MKISKGKKELLIVIALVVILYGFFGIIGIGCPIKYITGISCAGCGMTRAYLSLLKGDVSMAFYYHPLWFLVIPSAIFIFLKKKINIRIYKAVIAILIALFVVVYLARMLNTLDTIVVFEPENNIIMKLISVWRR